MLDYQIYRQTDLELSFVLGDLSLVDGGDGGDGGDGEDGEDGEDGGDLAQKLPVAILGPSEL